MDSTPLRIAVVFGEMGVGGVEQVVMNYYRYLDHTKVQFDFYVHEDSPNILRDEIESLGGRVFLIPSYTHVISYCRTLTRSFRDNGYLIVHIHLNTMSLFAQYSAWRAGVPVRITHNHSTAGKGETMRNMIKYVLRMFGNCFVTIRCACSNYAGEWMWGRRKLNRGLVTVWPNAISNEKFRLDLELRNSMRRKYGIEDKFVVGHIGRFVKQKNHEFLIRIFDEIQKRKDNSVLLLVGDGKLKPEIAGLVSELGLEEKVIFAGITNEQWAFYNAFDVFVFPSLYEGLGIVNIEAQAIGLHCVVSDRVPLEAKVTDYVDFMSLKDSPEKWADKVLEFATDYKRGDTQESLIKSGYSIAHAARRLEEWYLDLARNVSGQVRKGSAMS